MVLAAVVVLWVLPPQMIMLKVAIVAAALIASIAIALSCYRSADEVILQTHKTSWFWGSMIGMAIVGLLALAVLAGAISVPLLMPYPHRRPEDFYAEGILAVLLVECVGFAVFWAYHNFARRG
jgi:hypothetical protein